MAKAAVVSNGEDLPDNGDGNDDGGDDDDDRDNNDDRAINLPDTAVAAAAAVDIDDNNEGVLRKTLVTATIRRKNYATDADIPEGGALNGPTTKLRQLLSLTFEALAPPRSGCS